MINNVLTMKKIILTERFYINSKILVDSLGYCPVKEGIYVREQFMDDSYIWRKDDDLTQILYGSSKYLEYVRNCDGEYSQLNQEQILFFKKQQ